MLANRAAPPRAHGSVRGVLANRAAPPRDRSANAADTAGSIALGSRSAAARPARSAPCGAAERRTWPSPAWRLGALRARRLLLERHGVTR